MSEYLKNMKLKLIISSFLSIASVSAMDSSPEEEARNFMKVAYRSAERLGSYITKAVEAHKCKGHNTPLEPNWRDLYLTEGEREVWGQEAEKFYQNVVAAFDLNDPYAASLLYRTLPDEKEKAIAALKKSIAFKKEKGIRAGFPQDVTLLMDALEISTKTVEGIQSLEEIDINRAISCYEYLSCNLEELQSDLAFQALLCLQGNPKTYFAIGQSYIKRNNPEEGLRWIERYVQDVKEPATNSLSYSSSSVLGYFESLVSSLNYSSVCQLEVARLTHQYVINIDMLTGKAFPIHLNYYKLLKLMKNQSDIQLQVMPLVSNCAFNMGMPVIDALPAYILLKQTNDQSHQIAMEIFRVSRTLAKIAEDYVKGNPRLICQFAQTQEADAQALDDWGIVVDMYRRAANNGCSDGIKALANSPHFHRIIEKTIGIQEATKLLVRHDLTQGLLNLYDQMNNPVFLVVLSLMPRRKAETVSQNVHDLLTQYQDNYAPALDLKIHQLLNTKNLNEEDEFAMKSRIYIPQHPRKEWVIPTDAYNRNGHYFKSKQAALVFQESLVALDKKLEEEKQQKIQELSTQKMVIIDALSAKDQFNLAQEYQLITQALKLERFLDGYRLVLEKSAEKGFLPAVEELQELYSPQGVLPSPEKAAFYGQIKDILINEELGLLEKAAKFHDAFKK